jgi:hypothetical protein
MGALRLPWLLESACEFIYLITPTPATSVGGPNPFPLLLVINY